MVATSLMSLWVGVARYLVGVAWPVNVGLPLLLCVSQSVEVTMTKAAMVVKPPSMAAARTRSHLERMMAHVMVGPQCAHNSNVYNYI